MNIERAARYNYLKGIYYAEEKHRNWRRTWTEEHKEIHRKLKDKPFGLCFECLGFVEIWRKV